MRWCRQGFESAQTLGQQMQPAQLTENPLHPTGAGRDHFAKAENFIGETRRFGVNHSRRNVGEIGGRLLGPVRQTMTHLIHQPQRQFRAAFTHLLQPFCVPLGYGFGIDRRRFLLSDRRRFFFRFLTPRRQPVRCPQWRLTRFDRGGVFSRQQQQPQAMLAGKLATGASAFAHQRLQIHRHLIRRAAAALAFAP